MENNVSKELLNLIVDYGNFNEEADTFLEDKSDTFLECYLSLKDTLFEKIEELVEQLANQNELKEEVC
jgi:hypothetical protein